MIYRNELHLLGLGKADEYSAPTNTILGVGKNLQLCQLHNEASAFKFH